MLSSRVIGKWSVFVSHCVVSTLQAIMYGTRFELQKMLSGWVKFLVFMASSIGIAGGSVIFILKMLIMVVKWCALSLSIKWVFAGSSHLIWCQLKLPAHMSRTGQHVYVSVGLSRRNFSSAMVVLLLLPLLYILNRCMVPNWQVSWIADILGCLMLICTQQLVSISVLMSV